jgi:DNA-directed RNA polymerase subunit RPC12/RpoP
MTKYLLFCDYCNWKKISNLEGDDVLELKNDSMSSRKYRCLNCGRAVSPKKIKDPQKEMEKKAKEQSLKKENEKWAEDNFKFKENFLNEDVEDE